MDAKARNKLLETLERRQRDQLIQLSATARSFLKGYVGNETLEVAVLRAEAAGDAIDDAMRVDVLIKPSCALYVVPDPRAESHELIDDIATELAAELAEAREQEWLDQREEHWQELEDERDAEMAAERGQEWEDERLAEWAELEAERLEEAQDELAEYDTEVIDG